MTKVGNNLILKSYVHDVHMGIAIYCLIFIMHYPQYDLQFSGLGTVISYYNNNWHPIREQWVEYYKNSTFTLDERTNNRLESINGTVKSVCARCVYVTGPAKRDQVGTELHLITKQFISWILHNRFILYQL